MGLFPHQHAVPSMSSFESPIIVWGPRQEPLGLAGDWTTGVTGLYDTDATHLTFILAAVLSPLVHFIIRGMRD